jgi:hypothetical protein
MTKLCAVFGAIAAAVAALYCLPRRSQQPGNDAALRNELRQIHAHLKIQRRALHDTRSVLNDAHKLIWTVSKGVGKQPS